MGIVDCVMCVWVRYIMQHSDPEVCQWLPVLERRLDVSAEEAAETVLTELDAMVDSGIATEEAVMLVLEHAAYQVTILMDMHVKRAEGVMGWDAGMSCILWTHSEVVKVIVPLRVRKWARLIRSSIRLILIVVVIFPYNRTSRT